MPRVDFLSPGTKTSSIQIQIREGGSQITLQNMKNKDGTPIASSYTWENRYFLIWSLLLIKDLMKMCTLIHADKNYSKILFKNISK